MLETVLLNSLEKVFPESNLEESRKPNLIAMKNEPLSFQVAYRLSSDSGKNEPLYVNVKSDLPITAYSVGYVPVLQTAVGNYPEKYNPGLIPDMLFKKSINSEIIENKFAFDLAWYSEKDENTVLYAIRDVWQSLWFQINENEATLKPGVYPVTIDFYSRANNKFLCSTETSVEIVDAEIPAQKVLCTNWFHYDCITGMHHVDMLSDRFFEIFENYISVASKNGMNLLLTPFFTPSLDTPVGKERETIQLVGVNVESGVYSFDFSLVKKFMGICQKHGITHFEHVHLFTQWGAKSAIKVLATVDGEYKKIFDWDVASTDPRYTEFLRTYLVELKNFLKAEGLENNIVFHISDEPTSSNAAIYRQARETISDLLEGFTVGDALSDYRFYEEGLVETPIVFVHEMEPFIGKCKKLWCYYTGLPDGKLERCSNRLLINSSERNRILGLQMYYYGIQGFLHWGYNYYHDVLSTGLTDPKLNPGGYKGLPGASFLVYPASDGTVIESIRQKVFGEGMIDIRLLELAESLCGRDAVMNVIHKHYGEVTFFTEAESPEKFLNFIEEIKNLIKGETTK